MLLLDTHLIIWARLEPGKIPAHIRSALAAGEMPVAVSTISYAEIAIKQSIGKLSLPPGFIATTAPAMGCEELAFTPAHAVELAHLPLHHRDPFDRMLIAQATVERATLATVNEIFVHYDVALLDVDG